MAFSYSLAALFKMLEESRLRVFTKGENPNPDENSANIEEKVKKEECGDTDTVDRMNRMFNARQSAEHIAETFSRKPSCLPNNILIAPLCRVIVDAFDALIHAQPFAAPSLQILYESCANEVEGACGKHKPSQFITFAFALSTFFKMVEHTRLGLSGPEEEDRVDKIEPAAGCNSCTVKQPPPAVQEISVLAPYGGFTMKLTPVPTFENTVLEQPGLKIRKATKVVDKGLSFLNRVDHISPMRGVQEQTASIRINAASAVKPRPIDSATYRPPIYDSTPATTSTSAQNEERKTRKRVLYDSDKGSKRVLTCLCGRTGNRVEMKSHSLSCPIRVDLLEKRKKDANVLANLSPAKCPLPECDYRSVNERKFRDHCDKFHSNLAFSMTTYKLKCEIRCPYCPMLFLALGTLNTHIQRLHPSHLSDTDPIILCSECGYSCAKFFQMFQHWTKERQREWLSHREHHFLFDYEMAAFVESEDEES
ncbi:hypothetical protein PFISCL1PPCAC_4397 [Pristionchus fissidentatus]|uniref:C2H2-type domain-containing protein n=1 Tax=Pristionchus fissidentatus TaxID=1538716 RepID=A0AAV5V0P0_9BILA|nr:hypothetical protein PFISCL1PPCAC_4397 [Pristionchus fissidentatus]